MLYNKISKLIIYLGLFCFFSLNGCKQTKFETLKSRAIAEYDFTIQDFNIDCFEFEGPFLISVIINDNLDTVYAKFGWSYITEQDTFWIYYYGHTDKKSSDGIGFSENIDVLRSICFEERKKTKE